MSNWGTVLAGGVKGFADKKVEYLDAREEEEREKRKAKFLEQLRLDTAKQVADYQEAIAAARPDEKMSTVDYTTGEYISRDRDGNEKTRRKLTDAELEDRKNGQRKTQLDLDYAAERIKSEQHDRMIAERNAETSRIAASNRGERSAKGATDNTLAGAATSLIGLNDSAVNTLTKAGVAPHQISNAAMIAAAGAKKDGSGIDGAQIRFNDWLSMMQAGVVPETENIGGRQEPKLDKEGKPTYRWNPEVTRQANKNYRSKYKLDGGK